MRKNASEKNRLCAAGTVCVLLALFVGIASADDSASRKTFTVSGERPWTKTGISVLKEQWLTIEAEGIIRNTHVSFFEKLVGVDFENHNGPAGTYLYDRDTRERAEKQGVKDVSFPLPAQRKGPWPPFSLIGKIGVSGKIGRAHV